MLFNEEFSISVIQLSEMVPILQISVDFVVGLCFVFHLCAYCNVALTSSK